MKNTALTPNERLAQAMKNAGYNDPSLAEKLGTTKQTVYKLRHGIAPISIRWANQIAKILNVTSGYLLGIDEDSNALIATSNKQIIIPEYDVSAQAGSGSVLSDSQSMVPINSWSIPIAHILSFTDTPGSLAVIKIEGDSMEPEYFSGERVLVDLSKKVPSPPGVYVLWDGFGLVFKRIEIILGSNPPTIKISSANKEYSEYERYLEDITINGRVVGKWMWK